MQVDLKVVDSPVDKLYMEFARRGGPNDPVHSWNQTTRSSKFARPLGALNRSYPLMLLRTMMVVVVAALGIDSSSGFSLVGLAHEGQTWCQSQINRVDAWRAQFSKDIAQTGIARSSSGPTDAASQFPTMPNGMMAFASEPTHQTRTDEAFANVVDAMIADFEDQTTVADVADDDTNLFPGLAYALNREAEGLSIPATESLGSDVGVTLDNASDAKALTVDNESRAQRVAAAIDLTGQAVHAWMSLVQVTPTGR